MLPLPGELLREFNDQRRWARHAVARRKLRDVGVIHLRICVAQEVRTLGAHQVDVLVAIHVPQARLRSAASTALDRIFTPHPVSAWQGRRSYFTPTAEAGVL
jgi:hypothetical protein